MDGLRRRRVMRRMAGREGDGGIVAERRFGCEWSGGLRCAIWWLVIPREAARLIRAWVLRRG